MEEIVNWLITIEQRAADFYRDTARSFRDDERLSSFLNAMAEEEASHFRIMHRAAAYMKDKGGIPSSVTLDAVTREHIEAPFAKGRELLSRETLTREAMIECLVAIEFSECNDILRYVIETLEEENREFMDAAAGIQQHLKRIETFLATEPAGIKHRDNLKLIPPIWKGRILIVDDTEPVLEFLSAIFEDEAGVETARNGEEALRKAKERYFDVIISDIRMPVMNGIEFYKEAVKLDTALGKRFIFFAASPSPEERAFFSQNNLRFMAKPQSVQNIRLAVNDIIMNRP